MERMDLMLGVDYKHGHPCGWTTLRAETIELPVPESRQLLCGRCFGILEVSMEGIFGIHHQDRRIECRRCTPQTTGSPMSPVVPNLFVDLDNPMLGDVTVLFDQVAHIGARRRADGIEGFHAVENFHDLVDCYRLLPKDCRDGHFSLPFSNAKSLKELFLDVEAADLDALNGSRQRRVFCGKFNRPWSDDLTGYELLVTEQPERIFHVDVPEHVAADEAAAMGKRVTEAFDTKAHVYVLGEIERADAAGRFAVKPATLNHIYIRSR